MAYYNQDERFTESESISTNYDRGYGYGYGRGPREDERFTETQTTTYYDDGDIPPPPQVPYPWRPHWHAGRRTYEFINQETDERTFEFPGRRPYGGYEEQTTTTTTYVDEDRRGDYYGGPPPQEQRHGHGLMYGALGAAAGVAGGVFLAHEAGDIRDDYERDKYRVEEGVEDFPENAARWTGERVQEVEDIPEDVEGGFDRFGRRVEQGFDDVVDAPEEEAGWAGRKVGDVERFGDNVDDAYDEGRYERRYEDDRRYDDDNGW